MLYSFFGILFGYMDSRRYGGSFCSAHIYLLHSHSNRLASAVKSIMVFQYKKFELRVNTQVSCSLRPPFQNIQDGVILPPRNGTVKKSFLDTSISCSCCYRTVVWFSELRYKFHPNDRYSFGFEYHL